MTTLDVRPASASDVAQVATVWQEAWHDGHRGHVSDELVAARDAAYFGARAEELVGSTLVVDDPDGDGLLGVVITRDDELQQIMVDARGRGRGVGDALLGAAERRIGADHDAAWLAVVPGNTAARAFYERRGWTDHGEETYRAVTLGDRTVPVVVRRYVKQLR